MTYPLPDSQRTFATALQISASDASSLAMKSRGNSGHYINARNRRNGEGKRGGRPIIRWGAVAALKRIFTRNRIPTASDIGKLGNAIRREREREAIRARCDEIRERLGMEPARWPE